MKRVKVFLVFAFVCLLFIPYFLFPISSNTFAIDHLWKQITQNEEKQIIEPSQFGSQMSVIIGQGILTIEGYTSPRASVQLTSSQDNLGKKVCQANRKGYFKFDRVILPKNPGELWLQSTDTEGLTGPPVAIAEPVSDYQKIENVILPPSLAQSKASFLKNTQSFTFGHAIPNSEIEINLFQKHSLRQTLASKTVQMVLGNSATPPQTKKMTTSTDSQGYFRIFLPNQTPKSFRYYVGNIFHNNYSPKSHLLSFRVFSFWQFLWQKILYWSSNLILALIFLFKNLLFWIGLEIITLFFLIRRRILYHHPSPP